MELHRDVYHFAWSHLARADRVILTEEPPESYSDATTVPNMLAEVAVTPGALKIIDDGATIALNLAALGPMTWRANGVATRAVFVDDASHRVLGAVAIGTRTIVATDMPAAGQIRISSGTNVIGLVGSGELPILDGPLPPEIPSLPASIAQIMAEVDVLGETVGPMSDAIDAITATLALMKTKLDTLQTGGSTGGGGTTPPAPVPVVSALTLGTYTDTAANDDFAPLVAAATATNAPTVWRFSGGSVVNDVSVRLGAFGQFSVNRASGVVTYTPDDPAINAFEGATTTDTANLIATNAAGDSAPATVTVNIVGQVDVVDGIEVVVPPSGETEVDMNLASIPDGNNVTVTNNTPVDLKVYF